MLLLKSTQIMTNLGTNYISIAKDVFEDEINSLKLVKDNIDSSFISAVDIIKGKVPPGRVVVIGLGKSGHIGNKIAASLASTGTPSFFVHAAEAGHGDLGMITKEDVVLAISYSGTGSELETVIGYTKRNGIPLLSMTKASPSVLFDASDYNLNITITREACPLGLAPTASSTACLVMGDAIALTLMQARGFSEVDYAQTHPHGALGRKLLLSVSEIMVQGENIPILDQKLTIKEAILKISQFGLGVGVVVDSRMIPVGVFTDGDIRRVLDNETNLRETVVSDAMTKNFQKINQTKLAVEAVSLMEQNRIDSLPVIGSDYSLVGVITLKDLLSYGII